MTRLPPRIAYITAGAAGMYCGSCMRDNTLAAALHRNGVDITLIPTYTPIRTDEDDVSLDQIFFGGINVYLQQKLPWFRRVPLFLDRLLDRPALIRWLSRDGVELRPDRLGDLTLSMLRGAAGHQAREVEKLIRWMREHLRPDLINLTNMLIAGCVPSLKKELGVPVIVTLQGDDIFLDGLPDHYRRQAIELIQEIAQQVDGFIVFSQYYADFMSQYFSIPAEKMHRVPLGINTADFDTLAAPLSPRTEGPLTIGYLARLAPEKGLHILVDAFKQLRARNRDNDTRLLIAGWLGQQHESYAQQQFKSLDGAGLSNAYENWGTIDRQQKLDFLRRLDVLSVPTTYQEPKGLFILEAMAAGVAVVQPSHGAFPELIADTQGGSLCLPNDATDLSHKLEELLTDHDRRKRLGEAGRAAVRARHNADCMAQETLRTYQTFVGQTLS